MEVFPNVLNELTQIQSQTEIDSSCKLQSLSHKNSVGKESQSPLKIGQSIDINLQNSFSISETIPNKNSSQCTIDQKQNSTFNKRKFSKDSMRYGTPYDTGDNRKSNANVVLYKKSPQNSYSLEQHLKNIIKTKPKVIDPEIEREENMRIQRLEAAQKRETELFNTPLKMRVDERSFSSMKERQKRSSERKNIVSYTLRQIYKGGSEKNYNNKQSSNQSLQISSFLTETNASMQLGQSSMRQSKIKDSSNSMALAMKSDVVKVLSDESEKKILTQYKRIRPQKPSFNVKIDYWDYKGFYDQFEFSSPSLKKGVQRARMNPRNVEMNNSAYLESKQERNGSLQEQKQQAVNIQKLVRPASNEVRSLRQHIQHAQGDKLLQRYEYQKQTKYQCQTADQQSIGDMGISIQSNMLKSVLDRKSQLEQEKRVKDKLNNLLEIERSVKYPFKIPRANNIEQFYEINAPSIKKAALNFSGYQPIEKDKFFHIPNHQKNPYFKVYIDGQQKIINNYLNQDIKEERFFYQQDHDPFINDQVNYKVFEVLGNTYMKSIQPMEFTQKRRCGKEQSQLERELSIAETTFYQNQQEEAEAGNQQDLISEGSCSNISQK